MRVLIDHVSRYTYEEAAAGIVQILKVTPRPTDGQMIAGWRIDIDADGRLIPFQDAHGNLCHSFYAERALTELTIRVTGTVLTSDTAGLVSGCTEPLRAAVYLRPTDLTAASPAIAALADGCRHDDPVIQAHALMSEVHQRMTFNAGVTEAATPAAEAFAAGAGVCQDMAQVLIAAARHLGMPARYVSGHFAAPDHPQQEAAHAWAEIWLDRLGWVAFDPTQSLCATEGHIRVAVGLDALDAAPIRGTRRGGGAESLAVAVHGRESAKRPRAGAR